MSRFDFMSRESHAAVVEAKDETIRLLSAQLEQARATLAEERAANREFAKAALDTLKPAAPAGKQPKAPRQQDAPSAPAVGIDLSLVDPTDNEALMYIARQEIPVGTRVSASAVLRKVEQLRSQVLEAHGRKERTAGQAGIVPVRISAMIEEAEQVGRQQASVEVGGR